MIKKQKYLSVFSLMIISIIFIIATIMAIEQKNDSPDSPMPTLEDVRLCEESVIQHIVQKIEKQEIVDERLRSEMESGCYTFAKPLIVLDPYGESPLTALILFETEMPSRIEIAVLSEDENTSIVHAFNEVATQHTIPVYGLYPDRVNVITLRLISEDYELISENMVEIQTEPLPEWLDDYIILTETYQDNCGDGLNFMIQIPKFAFDKNGIPRWFLSDVTWQLSPAAPNQTEQHHWLVPYGEYSEGDTVICEMDLLGKIYKVWFTPYGLHHDLIIIPNGNLLVTGSHGQTVEDLLVEIDASTGGIVHTLDLKTILQRTRFNSVQDWAHINSIVWDENDDTIIISSNTQCTVAKITWPEGDIKWILGDPIEYLPRLQMYLLEPIGDEFEYFYNQHHATILPDYDNTSDTIDIMLFDNGLTRFERGMPLREAWASAEEIMNHNNYSRIVHYRINEKNMTVEQIWQYGKERGEDLFSISRGSVQLLSNDNFLGSFTRQNEMELFDLAMSCILVETAQDGTIVWDAEVFSKGERGSFGTYRSFRYPVYFPDDKEHDIYVETQNLIQPKMLEQNN